MIISHNNSKRTVVTLRDVLYPSGDMGSWRDVAKITKRPTAKALTTSNSAGGAAAAGLLAVDHVKDGTSTASSTTSIEDLQTSPNGTFSSISYSNDNDNFLYLAQHEEKRLYERLLLEDWRITKAIQADPTRFRRTRSDIEGHSNSETTNSDKCPEAKYRRLDNIGVGELQSGSRTEPTAESPVQVDGRNNNKVRFADLYMQTAYMICIYVKFQIASLQYNQLCHFK